VFGGGRRLDQVGCYSRRWCVGHSVLKIVEAGPLGVHCASRDYRWGHEWGFGLTAFAACDSPMSINSYEAVLGASDFPNNFGGSDVLVSRSNKSGVAGSCATTWAQFCVRLIGLCVFWASLGAVLVDMSCGATPVTRTGLPFIIDQRAVPRNLHFGGYMLRYFHYDRVCSVGDLESVGTRPVFVLDRDDVTRRG
jgi:hypothetical protein